MAVTSACSLMAADVEVKAKADVDKPKVEAEVKGDADANRTVRQEARLESSVKPANRMSQLLGMEVRNRQGEKLGEIKDFVVDLKSGKISYVAMTTGGVLGLGVREKLIAIPLGDFTVAENRDNAIILDATKGEIEDAPGFAATNWPDYRTARFDEAPFWRPKGSAPSGETGKAKLYTEPRDRKIETKVEIDK